MVSSSYLLKTRSSDLFFMMNRDRGSIICAMVLDGFLLLYKENELEWVFSAAAGFENRARRPPKPVSFW